jgi:hypothetical protein
MRLLAKRGEVNRQELVKLLNGQKWLTDLVMNSLAKLGLVEAEFVKAGRGRPPKVFRLTEKGRQVADNLPEKILQEAWRVAVGQDFSPKDFSQNNNSAKPSFKEVVGKTGQFKRDLINLTKKLDYLIIRAGCVAQISFENLERKAPEKELREEEKAEKIPLRGGKKPEKREGKRKNADSKRAEEILNRLREGKPKRGGIESIGEIIKRLKSGGKSSPTEEGYY